MKNLKKIRNFRNVSQEELANLIGVSIDVIREWESGVSEPSAHELTLLCGYFKCTPQYLFGFEGEKLSFYRPLKCPRCGSLSFSLLPEYHLSLRARIIEHICAIIFYFCIFSCVLQILAVLFSLNTVELNLKPTFIALIIVAIVYVVTRIVRILIESRTHTKAICHDCKHKWLFD